MAGSALIVTRANGETPTTDGVFAGLSFFLVQKLPLRSSFVSKIQSNGGRVVKLEAQADHVIADHIRPGQCPPGSLSYTFINTALEEGDLPDPTAHSAGAPQATVRPPATGLPKKGTRTPFTAEDDRVLYLWVKKHEARGASVKGNELYKRLEAINPRHTFQAWRDRYVKRLHDQPPPGVDVDAAVNGDDEDESPAHRPTQRDHSKKDESPKKRQKLAVDVDGFDQDDVEKLIAMGGDIENIEAGRTEEAWEAFGELWSEHSAAAWHRLWDEIARPEYLKRSIAEKGKKAAKDGLSEALLDGTAGEPREVEPQESTPDRPQSSAASLKRKRGTPTSRTQATHGRKKQKEGHNMSGDAGSGDDDLPDGEPAVTHASAPQPNGSDPTVNGRRHSHHQSLPAEVPASTADALGSKTGIQRDISALPTSDANRAAATQLDDDYQRMLAEGTPQPSQEQGEGNEEDEDGEKPPLATSDANRAAAMQLDDDFERLQAEQTPVASQATNGDPQATDVHPSSDGRGEHLITSDLNRGADQQLRRESMSSIEGQKDGALLSTSDHSHFPHQQPRERREEDDYDKRSGSASGREEIPRSEALASQIGDDDPSDMVQLKGDALTVANLATQDEQHRGPLVRGTDVPQDDEIQDRSDFVQYLRSLQRDAPSTGKSEFVPGAQDAMLSAPSRESAMTAETRLALPGAGAGKGMIEHPPMQDPALDELPLSSQQELDQIMDETLNWPESPGTARQKQVSPPKSQEQPSAVFETQVRYPLLPSQPPDGELSSPGQLQEVQYPDLPSTGAKPRAESEEELQARFDREVLGAGPGSQNVGNDDAAADDDEEEGEVPMYQDFRDQAEDDIYLHVPEPEGGFGFSSSQPQLSQQLTEDADLRYRQQEGVDLEVTEPGGGFGFSSSPPKSSQHTKSYRSPTKVAAARPQSVIVEAEEENAGTAHTREAIEITSSSSSSSSAADPKSPPELEDEEMPVDYPRALETQDIYNAQTQAPDFDMPLPDDGSDSPAPSPELHLSPNKPTAQESQAALAETQALSDDDVNEYIDRMTLAYNYKESDVIAALKCTSMRAELADLVLLERKAGKGLPKDVPGIWSADEDKAALGGNARKLRELEERHGWAEVWARMEFLREYEGDGEEEL